MDSNVFIVLKLLKVHNYNFSIKELTKRLLSDTDKGVVAISNTLDYFNVKSVVATVPKTAINELPKYFIAQVRRNNKSNLILVSNKENGKIKGYFDNKTSMLLNRDDFFVDWTGFIIVIEKNEKLKNESSLKKHIINFVLILLVFLGVSYFFFITNSFLKTVFFIFSVLGLYFSSLIIKGKHSPDTVFSKFCKLSTNTDCGIVLNSKESKFLNLFDLSDGSVVYFSFLTLSFVFHSNTVLFYVLSVLSLPVIIYSIYHQYFNIKKWCPLCLVISTVLIAQFFVLSPIYTELEFNYFTLVQMTFILISIMISWYQIKILLEASKRNKELSIENLGFRRNHQLFFPYYNTLKKIDTSIGKTLEIKLGSDTPFVTIIAVTNPLCETCFEVHSTYMKLLNEYSDSLQIRFRFFVPYQNRSDPRTQISERFLQLYKEEDSEIFHQSFNEWYNKTSIKEWLKKWKECDDIKYNNILKTHKTWCATQQIDSTPTILLNGKLFPKFYNPFDIENFIEALLELEKKR